MYSTIIRLVNDTHPLPDEHNAAGLISLYSLTDRAFYLPPSNMLLNCDAAGALNDMCRAAGEEGGFECIITDAYRTRDQQEKKYLADLSRSTARPGCSEHETGLAVDIISTDISQTKKLSKYLRDNCHRFGYIYRYPRGREMITHMVEHTEHFRYVGVEAAGIMYEKGLTLEEYHDSSIVRPNPMEPAFIFMSIFGPRMKGHWQNWPDIDLNELKLLNPDVVGWIYMERTPIDYPVLFHREFPGYYLSHNFSDEPSAHGGIEMLDVPKDGIYILSGHHMKDFSMFMKLIEIHDERTFDVHPVISFDYEGTIYEATWFAAIIKEYSDRIPLPEGEGAEARREWLKRLKEISFATNDIIPDEKDKILICSTCTRLLDGEQVLYGVMRERQSVP